MTDAAVALPPPVATALANVVVSIADNKYFLARRLAESGVGAPTLESAVASTAIAQEEAGHARGLYTLLEEFPPELAPAPLERDDDRRRKYALSYLLEGASFVRSVAALTLADRGFTVLLRAAEDSAFPGLRKRAARILSDESFHQRYADGRVRELAGSPMLRRELAALLPEILCWFGPEDEAGLESLVDSGIVARGSGELRRAFLAELAGVLDTTGIDVPTDQELPWSRWNSLERRLTTSA